MTAARTRKYPALPIAATTSAPLRASRAGPWDQRQRDFRDSENSMTDLERVQHSIQFIKHRPKRAHQAGVRQDSRPDE